MRGIPEQGNAKMRAFSLQIWDAAGNTLIYIVYITIARALACA